MSVPYEESASRHLLHAIHDNRRVMRFAADEIHEIANILHQMNSDRLATRLVKVAQTLDEISNEIVDAHNEMVSEGIRDTQEATGNVLLALLKHATKETT